MEQSFLFSCQTDDVPPAVSEDYAELILRNQLLPAYLTENTGRYFFQQVNTQYTIMYTPLSEWRTGIDTFAYHTIPKLFTFIDTTSLEVSGILPVHLQPYLNLRGENILMGFLDSGIDYTHPAFRNGDGSTRILRIWDQADQTGPAPSGLSYGTEYTEAEINEALFSGNPFDIVSQTDDLGHGTAAAGIAAGSPDPEADFIGVAPESKIAFVKLKPAKQYLRDFFLIPEDSLAYQETDLMLGIHYLVNLSIQLRMPLVICMTLGTNQGGHTGDTPLENVLGFAQFNPGIYVVTGTGNEAGQGHHYQGQVTRTANSVDVELLVDEETRGFTIELWADAPELYSIGFTSPLGETIQPIQPRFDYSQDIYFYLETSRIRLSYYLVEILSGSQLAQMQFRTPAPGLWRIHVENRLFVDGIFHIWLPITGLVDPSIHFFSPNVDTTLVIPSCAEALLACSTYNAYNNSLYLYSGRGYTRNGIIKPDFASPGVNLTAPESGGLYQTFTGSCAASAFTAGATALLVESGLRMNPPRYFTPQEVKSLFRRGTRQSGFYTYPNREWGYGSMDLYGIFESFLRS